MSNQVEGIITKLFKGQVKEHPTYGPSAPFVLTVNGVNYRTFANLKKGDPFKEGDTVKFQWEEKFNEYSGSMENNIVKGTLENVSNPSATAKKSGWQDKQADPATGIRIANQACLERALNLLIHNSEGKFINHSDVYRIAQDMVEWVYANKPKSLLKPYENTVKADNLPHMHTNGSGDEDAPY